MSDLVNDQITRVLRNQLGATLVESVDLLYAEDPAVPNLTYTATGREILDWYKSRA